MGRGCPGENVRLPFMAAADGHGARGCSALRCINYYQQTRPGDVEVARDTNDAVRWLLRINARQRVADWNFGT